MIQAVEKTLQLNKQRIVGMNPVNKPTKIRGHCFIME